MMLLVDRHISIIAAWYQMGQDDSSYPSPGVGMPYNLSEPHPIVNALTRDAKPAIYDGAVEGHVLVKNTKNALPLRSPKLISVFGYDAKTPDSYMPNGNFIFSNPFMIGYEPAVFQLEDAFSSTILNEPYDYPVAFNGTLNVGGGSGANTGPYLSAPLDALQQRAYEDGSVVMWDTTGTPGSMGSVEISDACLVFINAFATEGLDPASAYDHYLDALVNKVAKTCPNTIVVIHNAGTRLVDQFVNNDNVTAVVFAHLPGQILRPRSGFFALWRRELQREASLYRRQEQIRLLLLLPHRRRHTLRALPAIRLRRGRAHRLPLLRRTRHPSPRATNSASVFHTHCSPSLVCTCPP